jgi:hypothetical protein
VLPHHRAVTYRLTLPQLEVTGNALAIARILEPYMGRLVLANPKSVKAATESAKTV